MQAVDGLSSPEQERADKLSGVFSCTGPLVSLDTAYEVDFTLSSLILALRARCSRSYSLITSAEIPWLQEEHVPVPEECPAAATGPF